MNKKILLVIIVTALLTVGAVGIVLSRDQTWIPPEFPPEYPHPQPPEDFEPQDRDRYLEVKTAITMINLTLSVILMGLYIKVYRDTKSEFTVGLIVMTFSLFLYALLSNPLLPILFGYRVWGVGLFSILPDIFTTVALSILLYLGLK